jgi:hypothetical protein
MKEALSRLMVPIFYSFLCLLLLIGCGGGGGGDGSAPQTDNQSQTNSYKIYGGTVTNFEIQLLVWSSKTLIGSAEGTAEFDLAAAGLSSIDHIEIITDGVVYIDAVQNLQNNATIGYNGDGTYAGYYIDSRFAEGFMNAIGLPDGKTTRLQSGGHFITDLGGPTARQEVKKSLMAQAMI